MISKKLNKIIELQNSIELGKLDYKKHDFNKVPLPSVFLRDIYTKILAIENADNEQSNLFRLLSNSKSGRKPPEKIYFQKNVEILLHAREDVLNNFKSNLFPILSDTTPKESFMGETSSQRKRTGLKISTPKQTLQRLPIALA